MWGVEGVKPNIQQSLRQLHRCMPQHTTPTPPLLHPSSEEGANHFSAKTEKNLNPPRPYGENIRDDQPPRPTTSRSAQDRTSKVELVLDDVGAGKCVNEGTGSAHVRVSEGEHTARGGSLCLVK